MAKDLTEKGIEDSAEGREDRLKGKVKDAAGGLTGDSKLQAEGKLPKVGVNEVDVAHDGWCQVYKGGYCNCDPDIRLLRPQSGTPSVN